MITNSKNGKQITTYESPAMRYCDTSKKWTPPDPPQWIVNNVVDKFELYLKELVAKKPKIKTLKYTLPQRTETQKPKLPKLSKNQFFLP